MDNNNMNFQNINPNSIGNQTPQVPNQVNNGMNIDSNIFNNNSNPVVTENLEDQKIFNNHENKYINQNITETSVTFDKSEVYNINNLNMNTEENIENNTPFKEQTQQKKATIKITGEAKVFLLIIAIIFLFIFFLPTIFEFINNIKYR